MCIYIVYSSRKIKLQNFNDVICAYRKYFRNQFLGIKYAEFNPLFTGAKCAYILHIAAEKLNFENFNNAIRAYRKYFRKRCLRMKYAEFSPLFTGAKCAYILLRAAEKLILKISMTSFAHTGSTFEKKFWGINMQNWILYSLAPTVHIYCL